MPLRRSRVVAAPALDPLAVLSRDQRVQRRAVVVRGNRRETTGPDRRDAPALRLDARACRCVVGLRDELLLARAHLERKRALRSLRQHHVRAVVDARRPIVRHL